MVYQKTQKVWNGFCCYAPLALAATRARIAIAAAVLTQTLPARCHRFRPGLQSESPGCFGGAQPMGGLCQPFAEETRFRKTILKTKQTLISFLITPLDS